ncbi:PREDICTED: luciferin 4-monooxygenase-like [Papilio polytes]|uniref:luciferin 4-monooxygenase-like n=1 Tax=Papilio polytes TaxID=76194 RepID=UPI000675C150|nr:PREDICTED: luciferin 4-monooxygenase-like [Papilio polytes]
MGVQKCMYDAVHWYMQKLALQIVAKSGKPSDQYHLGKMVLHCLKEEPDFILQIDGATDESETCKSALKRSVQCAGSLRKMGLNVGDHIVLMAPNHLDISIPFYAALYLGLGIGCVDVALTVGELEDLFKCEKPKVIFCQSEKAENVSNALKGINLDARIITFNDSGDYTTFAKFIEDSEETVESFRPNEFDPETTTAFLICTSGTTGVFKAAIITHANMAISTPYWWLRYNTFPKPTRMTLLTSPTQWITGVILILTTPILRITRLQTSLPVTVEHAYHLINTYKPTDIKMGANMMSSLLKSELRESCDFSCLELIMIGGSAVSQTLIDEIKTVVPNVDVCIGYGMSEISGLSIINYNCVPGACGQLLNCIQARLVNVDTQEDINEPNVPGELWLKGATLFKGYCDNKALTEETISEDGWLKTGDILYRDESWNFYFVERMKMLLKYRSYQISPLEIENVIQKHPGVHTVAVTGIDHPNDGDLPVACVVLHKGYDVTEDDIKKLVEESVSDSKQLRGGVMFMEKLPLTISSKINRSKLKEMVSKLAKEKH